MDRIETIYNRFLSGLFTLANPIKKSVKITECKVHICINYYALETILNDSKLGQYNIFNTYIDSINEGAVWADQDFRSSNHFYNPYKKKGLFGRRSAMDLGLEYYSDAIKLWPTNRNKAMFKLGAAAHIVQDMTVPQHANIRLLDDHHQYESFVKKNYMYFRVYNESLKPYILDSISDYVRFNSRLALKVHRKFKTIREDDCRFLRITKCSIPLSIRTTAGLFILYYNETANL